MITSFEEVMQLTETVSSVAAFQPEECRAYYDTLHSLPDWATVVEIGLQFGRSSSIAAQVARDKSFYYIGVDPFTAPPEACLEWMKLMGRVGIPFTLHKMTTEEVDWFPYVDCVLVDGDHNREGVKIDCERLLPLVRQGGYALFHDYGRQSLPDVYPTVQEWMKGREWEEVRVVDTLGIWRRK